MSRLEPVADDDADARDYDLRVREIALREAVNRARDVNGASVLHIAAQYEHFLRTGYVR